MIKIVSNIKKRLAVFLLSALLIGQGSGYLAQKLMVENNIRERIKDALSKIIDSNKYVINVDIDLDISDEVEEQITVLSEKNSNQSSNDMPEEKTTVEESLSSIQQSIESEEESSQSGYSVGLPIPGFEMDFTNSNKASKKAEEPKPPVMSVETKKPIEVTDESSNSNEPRVDKILSMTKPSRAEVKKMYISLILQEGAAPELIENIRQLTMAAAKFDRNRGDKLTIMTASFRERRDQRSAEQIMLKNIAEKIELLEQKREILNEDKSYAILNLNDYQLMDNTKEFVVPNDKYFVMGDNRDFSYDSRFWGLVPHRHIKGRAILVWFSMIFPWNQYDFKFRPHRVGTLIN